MSTSEERAGSSEGTKPKDNQMQYQPSILSKLRENQENILEEKRKQQEQQLIQQISNDSSKRKIFKNKFRLNSKNKDAQKLAKKLSKRQRKKLQEDIIRMSKMSQRELAAYKMLTDPNNDFLRKMAYGDDQTFMDMQRDAIWQTIRAKREHFGQDINAFMNSLSDDEFTEYIQNREASEEKLQETGRAKEFFQTQHIENIIQAREKLIMEEEKKHQEKQAEEEVHIENIEKDFKVFRDPTFDEFIQIVGKTYNPDLPLFTQLYILKEILQFYQITSNQSFLYFVVFNLFLNLSYFYINNKLLFKKTVPFFQFSRILLFFVMSSVLQEHFLVKTYYMHNYRVNINELFDQDEDFLFENEHFRALIRKTKNEFEYLVNPIYDLEEIFKNANPDIDAKYKKPSDTHYIQINQGDQVDLFQRTFRSSKFSYDNYNKMMGNYEKFFNAKLRELTNSLAEYISGQETHDSIQMTIQFFEQKWATPKEYIQSLDHEQQKLIKETTRQANHFVDTLIESLTTNFGEKKITVNSSKREKVAYLKKLADELEPFYQDREKFLQMLVDSQQRLLKAEIGEEGPLVPKKDLKFSEYVAIKNYFTPVDFERQSSIPIALPLVSVILYFGQRYGRRFKWF